MQTNLAIPIDVNYDHYLKNLTKKEKKRLKGRTSLSLKNIEPKTDNQIKTFTEYYNGKHLLLHGVAGTGKTIKTRSSPKNIFPLLSVLSILLNIDF